MVAYSFDKRFVAPILAGTKRQTIRRIGLRRHATRGSTLQLYSGMRTSNCRPIGTALCYSAARVELAWRDRTVSVLEADGSFTLVLDAGFDDFARADGFVDGAAMTEFWCKAHPDEHPFSGVLVRWTDFTPAEG